MVVWYQPKGLLGEAYWAALYHLHVFVFDGLHHEIAIRASHPQSQAATGA